MDWRAAQRALGEVINWVRRPGMEDGALRGDSWLVRLEGVNWRMRGRSKFLALDAMFLLGEDMEEWECADLGE